MNSNAAKSGTYFRNLDSIRFIAAAIVLLSHIFSPALQYLSLPAWLNRVLQTISYGGTGVSLFFVMSGFLITFLLIDEHNRSGSISLKNFYIRRTLRIWPLYFLVIVVAFQLYPLLKNLIGMNQPLGTNFWMHLVFLSNFDVIHVRQTCFGSDAMSQNITWSISIEEQFYVFWPLIFAFLPKKTWLATIIAILCVGMTYRLTVTNDFTLLYFHTLSVLPDLATGGLLALLIHTKLGIRRFFENTNTTGLFLYVLLAFIVLVFKEEIFDFKFGKAIERLVIAVLMAFVIGSQALVKNRNKLEAANWKFADNWGKYTYGIYLLHPFAMLLTDVPMRLLGYSQPSALSIVGSGIITVVITFLISYLSFHYFESYFLRLKKKFHA